MLFALVALPVVARAQRSPDQHMFRLGVAGGVIVPTADAHNALKTGVHAQAFGLVNLLPGLPLRLNLGYQKLDLKSLLATAQQAAAPSGTTGILAGTAGTQISLLPGPVRPYVVAGVGGFNVKNTLNAPTGSVSTSSLKFGIDGGVGIAISLGRLSAFVEGRVQNIYTDSGTVRLKNIQAVPVSFGILF
jgi:hypothetical protein